ncbi:Phage-related protein [Yersinia frederiksenii]|uniref:type II toxin-antitoxin system RelE/ParE family toxin n=1 Tax=Yersinia alsatica TaxID=2890317 RepID=UPI0005DE028D|nr:type II toxin-antitoxin system RelE/ParE family toxin [Yersinia alsatica]CFQ57419.1 Phage-related protein [Yersinia frederiksenii]CNI30643.1 Phage-related protein [Yersinia frederiksenii]
MYKINLLRLSQRELFKLPAGIQAALIKAMDELEAYGHELREPVVRDIGRGLKELRVSAKEGGGRGFFFYQAERQVYVIHILQKKTQKTPRRTLMLAYQRMKELKRRLQP